MQSFQIGANESGQRLDKFLVKYLPTAGQGFLYKMLRKKNITLNGKKAEGKEILQKDDIVNFFFSEETFQHFRGENVVTDEYQEAFQKLSSIQILYQDEHVMILHKPAGILTQKADKKDLSLNEWMIGSLLSEKRITAQGLETFRPSVANRLDRNTSGLVLCGISLAGSQALSQLLRERSVGKYYRTFVKGSVEENAHIKGYLSKDPVSNKVTILQTPGNADEEPIETAYRPIKQMGDMTYLEVELITGKPHQIRAHLASMGHPILGDPKYGDSKWNQKYSQPYQIKWQLLHAYRVEFPGMEGVMEKLSEKIITAPLPPIYQKLLEEK